MKKRYVLDTSVLIKNAENFFNFEDNYLYITGTTLQELDSKKDAPGETGYNARRACRILDRLRESGDLTGGVDLPEGGKVFILAEPKNWNLPPAWSKTKPDNTIINAAIDLQKNDDSLPVILVTDDASMRVNASVNGLLAEEIRSDRIEGNIYTGHDDLYLDGDTANIVVRTEGLLPEDAAKIKEEEIFDQRNTSENEQFTRFENLLVDLEGDDKEKLLAPNITMVQQYVNEYDAKTAEQFVNHLIELKTFHDRMTMISKECASLGIVYGSDETNSEIKIIYEGNEEKYIPVERFADVVSASSEGFSRMISAYIALSDRFKDKTEYPLMTQFQAQMDFRLE